MIYVDHKITLDVHNVAAPVFVRLKKKDSARRILVYLTEKSQPYQITEDCYAVFTAKKPDGKVIFNDCTIDGNTIIYEITDQTTAAVGQFDAEIKLYGGDGKLITSPSFTIVVADTVYDEGDEIESTDEYNALALFISRIRELEDGSVVAVGLTPFIGDNGNWWIGHTDTGMPAQGDSYLLTEEDKVEIAALVLAEFPVYEGEVVEE